MNIVSLLPSATEICAALGLRLSAVSHECDYPPEVAALPRITSSILGHGLSQGEIDAAVSAAVREGRSLYQVDAALLGELAPDLIVTQGLCDVCAVTEDTVFSAMGALPKDVVERTVVLSLDARSVDGVFDDVRRVAAAAGVSERGEALIAGLIERWATLLVRADGRARRGRLAFVEWADPPFTGGHWVPEMIQAAGGIDVLGAAGVDSARTTWAAIEGAEPEVIVVGCCGYGLHDNTQTARRLLERPEIAAMFAVRAGRLWAVDANSMFSRPAPRLVRGAEVLEHILHGDGADLPGEAARIT